MSGFSSGFKPSSTSTPFLSSSDGGQFTGSVEFGDEATFNAEVQFLDTVTIQGDLTASQGINIPDDKFLRFGNTDVVAFYDETPGAEGGASGTSGDDILVVSGSGLRLQKDFSGVTKVEAANLTNGANSTSRLVVTANNAGDVNRPGGSWVAFSDAYTGGFGSWFAGDTGLLTNTGSPRLVMASRHPNGTIAFYTGGSAEDDIRALIDQNGKMGIGATDPVSLLEVRGPAGTGANCAGVVTISTAETSIVFADVLGKLNFQAPKETGTDAITVAAAIEAVADSEFNATSNYTNMLFKTGESGAAAEKMKLGYDGQLTLGTTSTTAHGLEVLSRGTFRRSSERFYLEEFFSKRPAQNGTIDAVHTTEAARNANEHFEILGRTDGSHEIYDANVYWPDKAGTSENAGLNFGTQNVSGDQMILTPHLDTQAHSVVAQASTAWSGVAWNSSKELEWECAITSGDVSDYGFWAGVGLTSPGDASWAYTTDDDKAFFFSCADDTFGAITTNANLHFVYSAGGTDYITNLGISMADYTLYRLRITFGSDRKMRIFVNDTMYAITLTNTGTTAGGVTEGSNYYSAAMTADKALIPYVGIQTITAGYEAHQVHYMKMSRIIGFT